MNERPHRKRYIIKLKAEAQSRGSQAVKEEQEAVPIVEQKNDEDLKMIETGRLTEQWT